MSQLTTPYDQRRYIGTVCKITSQLVEINLPKASSHAGTHYAGYNIGGGQVGEFIVIEGEEHALLCRIIEVRLPERERLTIEPMAENDGVVNPIGLAHLLTAVDLTTGRALKGIPIYPRIGQHVFSAHPQLIKLAVESNTGEPKNQVQLATFPHAQNTAVSLSASQIFGRHCAVLGATGGGKSWTVAKLMEEIVRLNGKVILLDATGEFHTQSTSAEHTFLGGVPESENDTRCFLSFPYWHLTENDIFALFRPSAGAQAPKLREALRSLKLVSLQPDLGDQDLLKKAGTSKNKYQTAVKAYAKELSALGTKYDITQLSKQILEECIQPTNSTSWGAPNNNDMNYCSTLLSRIDTDINSPNLACVFKPEKLKTVPDAIEDFLNDKAKNLLRINLEFLSFELGTREIVVNAVGRYLLQLARNGEFRSTPIVVMLDEAHQFLDKTIGDETSKVSLDAFGLIAKEGRKYGLTCVLATQRPRDIPEDVLSQMGMFIVHRLINDRDRSVVEKACGNLDSSAASFLPTLSQGEAMIVGVDSPLPLPVLIKRPKHEPQSRSPNYDTQWGQTTAP